MNIGMCADHTDFEKVRKIKEMGFDFVEASFSGLAKEETSKVDEYICLLKELELPCVSMNGLLFGDFVLTGEKADHSKVKEYIDRNMERVSKLGTKVFVMGSGKARSYPDGFPREKALQQLASLFNDVLAPAAKKYGAVIAIEELRREESNIFTSCREVMEFLRQLNNPNINLLVDYYHAILGGDTHEELCSYAKDVVHVHIASPKNERAFPMPNDGDDYKGFFEALEKGGYKAKNISIEGKCKDNFYDDASKTLAYLRTL